MKKKLTVAPSKKMKILGIILAVIIAGIAYSAYLIFFGCCNNEEFFAGTPVNACTSTGGTITTHSCCRMLGDYPETCLVGACSCSPANSHEVKYCDCGQGKCWDSREGKCVARP